MFYFILSCHVKYLSGLKKFQFLLPSDLSPVIVLQKTNRRSVWSLLRIATNVEKIMKLLDPEQ